MIYYVDAKAFRDGDGSKERPFKHIGDAAAIAVAGDEVLVANGIYREKVTPRNAGTKEAPIVYKSMEKLGAVITGAEEISGWEKLVFNAINEIESNVFSLDDLKRLDIFKMYQFEDESIESTIVDNLNKLSDLKLIRILGNNYFKKVF